MAELLSPHGTPDICPLCMGHAGFLNAWVQNGWGPEGDQTRVFLPDDLTLTEVQEVADYLATAPNGHVPGMHSPEPPMTRKWISNYWLLWKTYANAIPAVPASGTDAYQALRTRAGEMLAMVEAMAEHYGGLG
jgi:hypothetical protein